LSGRGRGRRSALVRASGAATRWRAARLAATLLPIALLAALAACRERPPEGGGATRPPAAGEPAHLLLVTVDTLRPDALGWVGGANATPEIDRLAAEGARFPAAVAPVPLTLPSHSSLMTALVPLRHGVRDNGQVLGAAPATLAEALAAAGYATAAFVSGLPLAAGFGLDRGFAAYDDRLTAGEGAWLERPAGETTRAAAAWLAAVGAARPWALWVHYYDPHFPYEPPPELVRAGRRGAYDGEVAAVDRALGELLRAAAAAAGGRPLLTVFTADHGESLGEHGEGTHGFFVYDATVLVPLVVRFPGRVRPVEVRAPARLVDVAPTVLDLLGLPPLATAGGVDGVSLAPLLAGGGGGPPPALPPAYLETRQPWTSYGWAPLAAVRDGRFKLIAAPRPELYDLAADPGETVNLLPLSTPDGAAAGGPAAGAEAERAARRLRAALREVEARQAASAGVADDPETLARLAALGYVGAGAAPGEPPPGLPDPKDRIAMREALTAADDLLRRGRAAAALAGFERVLAGEPGNRFALVRSGIALARLGRDGEAIDRLRWAVAADPAQPENRAALADALLRTGRPAEAADEWAELVRLQPRRADAWSSLGTALGRAGRPADAVAALARAAELEPGSPDRLVRLAFAEHAAGRVADAAAHLEAAAALAPERFAHAGALGLLLADLGRGAEARPWLAASRASEPEHAAARYRLAALAAAEGNEPAARRALAEAVAADPALRPRAAADPRLAPLLR